MNGETARLTPALTPTVMDGGLHYRALDRIERRRYARQLAEMSGRDEKRK